MRWITKVHNVGDERERSGFLILPITVKHCDHGVDRSRVTSEETRWLEYATWVEVRREGKSDDYWHPVRFL